VIFSGMLSSWMRTLLIFVSMTGTGLLNAKARIAFAVYGPMPGSWRRNSSFFGIS